MRFGPDQMLISPLFLQIMSRILKYSGYIFKQYRPRSDGSYRSPLILAKTVWKYNVDSLERAVMLKRLIELLGKQWKMKHVLLKNKISFFTIIKKLLHIVFPSMKYYHIFFIQYACNKKSVKTQNMSIWQQNAEYKWLYEIHMHAKYPLKYREAKSFF